MILDHIEKLEFDNEEEEYMFDAQMTLARLSQGLFWLFQEISQAEIIVRERAAKENVTICFINGVLNSVPVDKLSCAFQWYAVSVYNYARLVGWLTSRNTEFTNEYVRRVIPRVTEYRHKVAAHFAITAPRNDNEADLIASIMTNIVYAHGFLRAGALSEIITDKNGKEMPPSNQTSWSLTKTHNSLLPRYWPDGPIESFQSIKLSAGATRKLRVDWND